MPTAGCDADLTNVLRVGIVTSVQSLDPRETADFVNVLALWQIFETPYAPTSGDAPPKPILFKEALKSEPEEGGCSVYSAAIEDEVRFSDGTLMTADHVAASLRRVNAFALQADVSVRGHRVFFTLKRPNPRPDLALTPLPCAITLEREGRMLGTGAYMVAPDATPERMHLVRNPYYRKKAPIAEIEFLLFPRGQDGQADMLRQAAGEGKVDFTTFLRLDEVRDLQSVRKSVEQGNSTALFYFNTERPALRDPRVRKAIALAIDREEIARQSYSNPLAYTASGILPPTMGRVPDGLTHDLDKARVLLAQSGVKPPEQPLRLMTIWGPRPYLPQPLPVAKKLAGQMAQLGFTVRIEPTRSLSEYFERTARGDYDLVLAGWIPDTPDPADFLEVALSSSYVPSATLSVNTGINLSRWRNTSMNNALKLYRADPCERHREEIARLVREETPLVPLIHGPTVVVQSWRIAKFPASFVTHPLFASMELAPVGGGPRSYFPRE